MIRQIAGLKSRVVSALLLLSVVFLAPVFSQNRVLQVSVSENVLPRLTDMTARTMAIELERAGLQVDSRGTYLPLSVEREEIHALAKTIGAPYIAALEFDTDGVTADIAMVLYDTVSGEPIAREERRGIPLELEFDTTIVAVTRTLVSEAGVRFDRPQPPPVDTTIASETVIGPFQSATRTLPDQPVTTMGAESVEGGIGFGFGMAPVLVTGKTSDFLKFGGMASVSVGYRFRGYAVDFETGVIVGFFRLFPEEPTAISNVDLLPLGISGRAIAVTTLPISFGISTSAGGALLSVGGTEQGYVSKAVPYVAAGIDVSLHLPRSFSLRIESNYITFFEGQYPIMAVTPSLSIAWKS